MTNGKRLVKLDRAMNEAFQGAFPEMKRSVVKFRGDVGAYGQGVQDGATINLARPVEQGARRAIGS